MPSNEEAFSEREFQVFLTSTRDCYVQLPHDYVLSNPILNDSKGKIQVFQIMEQDDYLCWSWHTHQQAPNKIGIPSTLAKCLRISEDDPITIKLLKDVKICKSVFVRPETIDDSEILEFNQERIEEELLSQVRIAYKNMKFPLFINNNISITLNAYQCGDDDKDTNVYIIDIDGSELIVETKHEIVDQVKQEKKKYYIKSKLAKLSSIAQRLNNNTHDEQIIDDDKFIYVSHDVANSIGLVNGDLVQVLHLNIIRKNIAKDESSEQATAEEQKKNPLESLKEFEERKERRIIYGRVQVLDRETTMGLCAVPTIFVGKHLVWMLGAVEHSTIYLKYLEEPLSPNHVRTVYVRAILDDTTTGKMEVSMNNHQELVKSFREWILERKSNHMLTVPSIAMSQRNVIHLKGFGNVLVSINESIIIPSKKNKEDQEVDEFPTFSEFLNKSSVENLYLLDATASYGISIVEDAIAVEHRHAIYSHVPDLCEITDISEQVQLILNRLQVQYSPEAVPFKKELGYSTHCNSNIIISGTVGNGKSYYAKALARHCNVYTIFVSCASLAGDRADTLSSKLRSYSQEAMINSPSLIIFDDIDTICPLEQEEAFPDVNVRVTASIFIEMLNSLSSFSTSYERNVNVIVTCKSLDETHKIIQNSKLFEHNFLLRVPNREQRRKIFERFLTPTNNNSYYTTTDDNEDAFDFSQYKMTEETLSSIVDSTENYSPLDVRNIIEKMINVKLQTLVEEGKYESLGVDTTLTRQEFTKASKDFITQSTEGIKLIKSTTSFSDIGGMKDVKNILRETFIFPTKYASLFENAPIKLRSGLLLYGPPGVGKTFIASAIARECGLNFISIKGPELLNKYVGASEQAVRDVFMQAESAKPCIVFFDEFDSIAAQRGHDNTGVTDRVVNQFLCQLDGVESRKGVYVLAATSRPDLIDAALLRPGRLDKSVCCDIPTEEERQDILEVINSNQSNIQLHTDVDFKELASLTHNFTGADLQALFFSATLTAYRDTSKTREKREDNVLDEDEHFFTVLLNNKADAKKKSKSVAVPTTAATTTHSHSVDHTDLTQQMKQIQSTLTTIVKKANNNHHSSSSSAKSNMDENKVTICKEHFMQALTTSRPSLSLEEIAKYEYIYSCFRGQSSEDYVEKLLSQKKRVTLA